MPAIKSKTTTTTCTEMRFSADEIVAALIKAGHMIPSMADVVFAVPGGGDYSNKELQINVDNPVIVRFKVRERNDDRDWRHGR